jgi:hypothetical protein
MPRFDPSIDNSYAACVDVLLGIATGRQSPSRALTPASQRLVELFQTMLRSGATEHELRSIADEPIAGADMQASEALTAWVDSLGIGCARVLCVSVDSDNEDLWTRYAANHSGAVLELRHIPEKSTPLLAAQKVRYAAEPPIIGAGPDFLLYGASRELNVRSLEAIFFTKKAEWSCQNEWRALTWRHDERSEFGDYRFFPEELAAIRFGRATTADFREALSTLVRRKYPQCVIDSQR